MKKIFLLLPILLTSCATLFSGTSKIVNVIPSDSSVDKVNIEIRNGELVQNTAIPSITTLKTKNQPVIITVKDKCYRQTTMVSNARINPIFLGNVITGGVFGTTTDAVSGALWTYDDTIVVPVNSNGTCK